VTRDDPTEPRVGQPLPAAGNAYIDPAKLIRYALDPDSPRGRHKAIVFERALGIGQRDWRYLRDCILDALPHEPVVTVRGPRSPDQRTTWAVHVPVTGLNGCESSVITAWKIVGQRPELTSIRVAKRSRAGRRSAN
jgi:hypothetical protein